MLALECGLQQLVQLWVRGDCWKMKVLERVRATGIRAEELLGSVSLESAFASALH